MSAHHRRSRRARHNNQSSGANTDRSRNSTTPFDPSDVAAFRLNLTDDGWYIDGDEPEEFANAQAAVGGSGPRRMPEPTRPCHVLVIALVRHHDDRAGQYAVQAAADAIRSAVRSLPEPDDPRIKLILVSPGTGRNG